MKANKARILIAEDEMVNIKVLVTTLSDYETIIAKTGEQAIAKALASPTPDLILLDINMPGMDGYDVCRILKENPDSRDIPVIFITVQASVEDETKGLQMGAVDYISKPFSPAIVKARVANHLELKRQRDLLQQLNMTDPLTQIANRRRLDEYFTASFNQALRSETPLCLLMIDIDNFKKLNDLAGHDYGDDCLRQVAQGIAKTLQRQADLAARFGGEEFCVILPATELEEGQVIAENIRAAVEALDIEHPQDDILRVTVSIGCTGMDSAPKDEQSMFKLADNLLYQAKQAGRNQVA